MHFLIFIYKYNFTSRIFYKKGIKIKVANKIILVMEGGEKVKIINSKIPILSVDNYLYSSCAIVDEKYYFTQSKTNQIHILDKSYHYLLKENLDKPYNSIVYNLNDDIFYLSSNNSNLIFNMDNKFKNIKEFDFANISKDPIISMDYSNTENTLYVVTKDNIISINKDNQNNVLLTRNAQAINNKITTFTAISVINKEIYIAYNKNNEAYLGKVVDGVITDEYYIDNNCNISNILSCDGIIKLFVVKNYNYIYETNLIIQDSQQEKEDRFYDKQYNKDYNYCPCSPTSQYHTCCSENKCDYENSICEMIESIALEEVGISHILNAEGEKLQKMICESNNLCDLLKANESINRTITNISMLEQVLYAKLELILNSNLHNSKDAICKKEDSQCQCQ